MAAKFMKSRGRVSMSLIIACAVVGACISYLSISSEPTPPPAIEPGMVLFRHARFSDSTEKRESGFLQCLSNEAPQINVLSSTEYLGTTRETSLRRARQLLERYGPAIQGIFCVCEVNAIGMLQALEEMKMAGKIPFVGCDPNATMIEALKAGRMAGIVLQDPLGIGSTAISTLVSHLDGNPVDLSITTKLMLATPDNLNSAEVQSLLNPPRFSGKSFDAVEARYTIAVIVKGQTYEYWQSVNAGAEQAAREAGGIQILFDSPELEDDVASQIAILRKFIDMKVDGICLAPIDSKKLIPVVIEAKGKGIPTVIFDSNLGDDELYDGPPAKISCVASNNVEVGAMAARRLAEIWQEKFAD